MPLLYSIISNLSVLNSQCKHNIFGLLLPSHLYLRSCKHKYQVLFIAWLESLCPFSDNFLNYDYTNQTSSVTSGGRQIWVSPVVWSKERKCIFNPTLITWENIYTWLASWVAKLLKQTGWTQGNLTNLGTQSQCWSRLCLTPIRNPVAQKEHLQFELRKILGPKLMLAERSLAAP